MLNAMPTGYEHLSEDELLEDLRCPARNATQTGSRGRRSCWGPSRTFTEKDAEEWGAMEDPAAEAAFESLVRGRAGKDSAA